MREAHIELRLAQRQQGLGSPNPLIIRAVSQTEATTSQHEDHESRRPQKRMRSEEGHLRDESLYTGRRNKCDSNYIQ